MFFLHTRASIRDLKKGKNTTLNVIKIPTANKTYSKCRNRKKKEILIYNQNEDS